MKKYSEHSNKNISINFPMTEPIVVISGGAHFFFCLPKYPIPTYTTSAGSLRALFSILAIDDMPQLPPPTGNKGLYDFTTFENMLKPYFTKFSLPTNISLLHFSQFFDINIHIFATELDTLTSKEFSAHATPHVPALQAIYASLSLPGMFAPIFIDGTCYCDGGLVNNYPIYEAVVNSPPDARIIGIKKPLPTIIFKEDDDTLLHYYKFIMKLVIEHQQIKPIPPELQYKIIAEVEINIPNETSIFDVLDIMHDPAKQQELRELGRTQMAHLPQLIF